MTDEVVGLAEPKALVPHFKINKSNLKIVQLGYLVSYQM